MLVRFAILTPVFPERIGGFSGRYSIDGHAGAGVEFRRVMVVPIDGSGRKDRKPVRFIVRHDSVIPDGMVLANTGGKLRLFERVPKAEEGK